MTLRLLDRADDGIGSPAQGGGPGEGSGLSNGDETLAWQLNQGIPRLTGHHLVRIDGDREQRRAGAGMTVILPPSQTATPDRPYASTRSGDWQPDQRGGGFGTRPVLSGRSHVRMTRRLWLIDPSHPRWVECHGESSLLPGGRRGERWTAGPRSEIGLRALGSRLGSFEGRLRTIVAVNQRDIHRALPTRVSCVRLLIKAHLLSLTQLVEARAQHRGGVEEQVAAA